MLNLSKAKIGSAWRTAAGKKATVDERMSDGRCIVLHGEGSNCIGLFHQPNGVSDWPGRNIVAPWPSAADIPDGYEDSGEFRAPEQGSGDEWLRPGAGRALCSVCSFGYADRPDSLIDDGKRHILRKKTIHAFDRALTDAEAKALTATEPHRNKPYMHTTEPAPEPISEGDRLMEFFRPKPYPVPFELGLPPTLKAPEPCACCGGQWPPSGASLFAQIPLCCPECGRLE